MNTTQVSKLLATKFERAQTIRSGSATRDGFSVRKNGEESVVVDYLRVDRNYADAAIVSQLEQYAEQLAAAGLAVNVCKDFNLMRLFVAAK